MNFRESEGLTRRVREEMDTGSTGLDLSDRHSLKQFPRELARLESLQRLKLPHCGQLSGARANSLPNSRSTGARDILKVFPTLRPEELSA
jgi:hypothetical protein